MCSTASGTSETGERKVASDVPAVTEPTEAYSISTCDTVVQDVTEPNEFYSVSLLDAEMQTHLSCAVARNAGDALDIAMSWVAAERLEARSGCRAFVEQLLVGIDHPDDTPILQSIAGRTSSTSMLIIASLRNVLLCTLPSHALQMPLPACKRASGMSMQMHVRSSDLTLPGSRIRSLRHIALLLAK